MGIYLNEYELKSNQIKIQSCHCTTYIASVLIFFAWVTTTYRLWLLFGHKVSKDIEASFFVVFFQAQLYYMSIF